MRRSHDKAIKLQNGLSLTIAANQAMMAWQARAASDFSAFEPHLSAYFHDKGISMLKELRSALLDEFEVE